MVSCRLNDASRREIFAKQILYRLILQHTNRCVATSAHVSHQRAFYRLHTWRISFRYHCLRENNIGARFKCKPLGVSSDYLNPSFCSICPAEIKGVSRFRESQQLPYLCHQYPSSGIMRLFLVWPAFLGNSFGLLFESLEHLLNSKTRTVSPYTLANHHSLYQPSAITPAVAYSFY